MSSEPPLLSSTYHAHPVGRLYVGWVLPALGMLLVAIPGTDAVASGDGRGIAASAVGLLLVAILALRFNRRAYWTVEFQAEELELRGRARRVLVPYAAVEVLDEVSWPWPANHVRLLTGRGAYSIPYMSGQDRFVGELVDRCPRASLRE